MSMLPPPKPLKPKPNKTPPPENRVKKCHELKIEPKYYEEIVNGKKRFEIRKNDRDFKEGDDVVLREHVGGQYTHATKLYGTITYVTDFQQKEGYVVFGVDYGRSLDGDY